MKSTIKRYSWGGFRARIHDNNGNRIAVLPGKTIGECLSKIAQFTARQSQISALHNTRGTA